MRQKRILESASKGPKSIKLKKKGGKMSPKVHSIKKKRKKKEKKRKPARPKTQKGGLGKS